MSSDTNNDKTLEEKIASVIQYRHRWRWRGLTAWIVVFTIAVGYVISQNRQRVSESHKLALQNKDRINDVQAARLESCRLTYGGLEIVIKKILPKPKTAEARMFFHKLHVAVNQLQKKCPRQVNPK